MGSGPESTWGVWGRPPMFELYFERNLQTSGIKVREGTPGGGYGVVKGKAE